MGVGDLLERWKRQDQIKEGAAENTKLLTDDGEVISTSTRNGITIERIRLPKGLFRRVRRGTEVLSFTNLTESKKGLK